MMTSFNPDWVSPPGDTIIELIEQNGESTGQFAYRMGISDTDFSELISGSFSLSAETAKLLSNQLGGTTEFWMKREENYRSALSKSSQRQPVKMHVQSWERKFPLKDMLKWGWLDRELSKEDALLKFFDCNNFANINEVYSRHLNVAAFRQSLAYEADPYATVCWLRRGLILQESVQCEDWDPEALKSSLPVIKRLSKLSDPRVFLPKLQKLCAQSGIAVVAAPLPSGCRASGATMFVSGTRAVIILSFRYRADDQFWFTFLHEVGHILLHDQQAIFLEDSSGVTEQEEEEANRFAREVLIPSHLTREYETLGTNWKQVVRFAAKAGVSSGIVVGQLQHDEKIPHSKWNFLKKRYKLANLPFSDME